jgi:hypothetical protein
VARSLPALSLEAHVAAGRARGRYLVYRNVPAPGRVVTFLEEFGGHSQHVIGRAAGRHGRIAFVPGAGPAGRRTITAMVTERGIAAKQLTVAHYTAPGPPKLGRPGDVMVRRRGGRIAISWSAVPGAVRYVVRATLKDGRSLQYLIAARRHATTVPAVPGFDAGKVLVAALDLANEPGPIGSARVRALPVACRSPRSVKGKLVCGSGTHKKPKHKKKRRTRKH